MTTSPLPTVALSIRQPWAWCIVSLPPDLAKDIENRDWITAFRGPFLVHTGQKFDMDGYQWIRVNFPDLPLPAPGSYPLGGVVGLSSVVNCVEKHLSPWFQGPVGFVLAHSRPLPFKPARGKLNFFNLHYEVL